MTGLRIDKWLWAARFYKTRTLAASACDLSRVKSNGQPVKPSREVKPGEFYQVRTEGGEFEIEVLALSGVRGPAPVARTLYRETEESVARREKEAQERKDLPHFHALPKGKPSKRDRRELDRFRGR